MGKDTFYFQHDNNARNDEKILELRSKFGAEGYGIFWMVVETMSENENGGVKASLIGGLSLGYGVAKEKLISVFKCCCAVGLFQLKQGNYVSKRLLTQKEFRKQLSEYGSEGAKKRWGGYRGANGVGIGEAISPPNAKERKGKERKGNKGVSFDKKNLAVVFSDGTTQLLGASQRTRLKFDDIKPEEIEKGYIV